MSIPSVSVQKTIQSPTVTPQALAWDGKQLWVSSRDLGFFYKLNSDGSKITEEVDPPGVIWAAAQTNGVMHCTIGKGLNDDRYVYSYEKGKGFTRLFECPDLAGSYLSYDGNNLYLSQWYQQRILKVEKDGKIAGTIQIGAEICGHAFANGVLYVLRGTENVTRPQDADGPPTPEQFKRGAKPREEQWWIARVDLKNGSAGVTDVAKI